MHIDSSLVGTPLKPYKTKIDWRATTNYAAAILDRNPLYFDDTREGGLLAHPMFPVSVTWPILENLGDFISATSFPKEALLTQVHYTERLILRRLIKPHDTLSILGRLAAIFPHRAGSHAVIQLDATDENGEPVFTEFIGALLRGVRCEQGQGIENLPQRPTLNKNENDIWQSVIKVDPLLPYIYDGCTRIHFPIHTSPWFAQSVGLPGIILQGTASLAFAVREIVAKEAESRPEAVKDIGGTFTGMVQPGTPITVRCRGQMDVENDLTIFFDIQNAEGQTVIHNGWVSLVSQS